MGFFKIDYPLSLILTKKAQKSLLLDADCRGKTGFVSKLQNNWQGGK